MNTNNRMRPFGVMFEEELQTDGVYIEPQYDEDESINVIVLENGRKVPYVEQGIIDGTKTETFVIKESSDDDDPTHLTHTKTVTSVQRETGDVDDTLQQSLGTKTTTRVERESPDSDVSASTVPFLLGTKTATKISGEGTDSD